MKWKNVLIGFAAAVFFSLLYGLGVFGSLENQVYDYFLHFRANRDRTNDVVFLNVDDPAVAHNGYFPWPRSITADALLRLKEYGARAAIFDIEYIDKGPPGVDAVYLNNGLSADFNHSFEEINSAAGEISSSINSGRMNRSDIGNSFQGLHEIIRSEQNNLFTKAQKIARDNDLYLIQTSSLFGRSWTTLNLRPYPLSGEQAERRFLAEERFSYPVAAAENAHKGNNTDILPALPGFSQVAEGAGFTNVEIDGDGIRRRIYLAQNIHDHWYLQLAFSPLINYLGNPDIELGSRRLLIKGAKLPGGEVKDISIPLDDEGRMLLDWPETNYSQSYKHVSFLGFTLLEEDEAIIEQYIQALSQTQIDFFDQYDTSLKTIPFLIGDLTELYDGIRELKNAALETSSDELFADYVEYRRLSRDLVRELLSIGIEEKVNALVPDLVEAFPGTAGEIAEEAQYITDLTAAIKQYLDEYDELTMEIESSVKDRFCILGRTDTGTTDIGANPFYGEYINVGTHGVVLDMILSQIFITLISTPWVILSAIVFVLLFFIISAKFQPVPRAIAGFAASVLVIAVTAALFRFTGIFFNPLLAVAAMITAVILREIVSYAGSEREKQFIRKAFSTYVSDEVVKEIITDPSRLQLGGTKRHMSAIFTDIQGFSTISEQLDPEVLVSLLNRYLTFMSDAVLEENGTIDKYEGDAIIAFFGAPIPTEDHAVRACNSAIAMKRIEHGLNRKIIEEKLSPSPLLTRIGINTGSMVAGNMGTGKKMDYTIMGNAVNLAARLEGVNKQYGTWVIASDDTIKETEGLFLTRRLDRVRVVGINEPVRLHEVIETNDFATPEQKKLVEVFHEALDLFEQRNWKEAAKGFKESLAIENQGPSAKYIERCKTFLVKPPKDTWDGVYNMTEK